MAPSHVKCVKITRFNLSSMGLHGEIIKEINVLYEIASYEKRYEISLNCCGYCTCTQDSV